MAHEHLRFTVKAWVMVVTKGIVRNAWDKAVLVVKDDTYELASDINNAGAQDDERVSEGRVRRAPR